MSVYMYFFISSLERNSSSIYLLLNSLKSASEIVEKSIVCSFLLPKLDKLFVSFRLFTKGSLL